MTASQAPTLASFLAGLGGHRTDAENSASPEAIARHQSDERAKLIDGFDRLPRVLLGRDEKPSLPYLTALGFQVRDAGDPLFLSVVPPEGWSIRPTRIDALCEVLDERGTVRFRVFYKAAHYDRHAHVAPHTRFETGALFLDADGDVAERSELATSVQRVVRDARGGFAHRGEMLRCSDRRKATPDENRAHLAAYDASEAEVRRWLEATYPDWREPAAYWDVEVAAA